MSFNLMVVIIVAISPISSSDSLTPLPPSTADVIQFGEQILQTHGYEIDCFSVWIEPYSGIKENLYGLLFMPIDAECSIGPLVVEFSASELQSTSPSRIYMNWWWPADESYPGRAKIKRSALRKIIPELEVWLDEAGDSNPIWDKCAVDQVKESAHSGDISKFNFTVTVEKNFYKVSVAQGAPKECWKDLGLVLFHPRGFSADIPREPVEP